MKKSILIASFLVLILVIFYKSIDIKGNRYISYGDNQEKCSVIKTKLNDNQILDQYNSYDYLKIDEIISNKKINYTELKNIISEQKKNSFEWGIYFNKMKVSLLSEEINMHKIIDYDNNEIDLDNLAYYLKKVKVTVNDVSIITIFKTTSKMYDKQQREFIKLNLVNGYHFKDISYYKNNLDSIVLEAGNLLASMNQKNGEYIYGYRTNNGNTVDSYNILRHAGSTWSLILLYQKYPSEDLKQTIINSINYLINNYILTYNEEIAFVIEKKSSEIKLGGNALTLLMLSDYYLTFQDDKYNEIAKKIANSILFMQLDDGSYNHVLNVDFTLKEAYRTVYYDGEATFSLLKFYSILKDEKYILASKKAIDYFIDNHYEQYRDHWISYAINEYLSYDMSDRYAYFALTNYTYNINRLDNNDTFGPIRLELLTTTYDSYELIKKNNPKVLNDFLIGKLKYSIEKNLDVLFNYYIDDEIAMYSEKPYLVRSGFHDIQSNFRMRIDDIQHSLIGLLSYQSIKEKL